MAYLAKYKKTDFKKLSWKEYGETLGMLYKKVDAYIRKRRIKITAVVPILRAGAFPGAYLAYKLHILRVLPVQYHYLFAKKSIELRKILGIPRNVLSLSVKPVFLLVEGNHCFGVTASKAAQDIKKTFPGCTIIYAADHMDYSYQHINYVDVVFYGKLTNETRALTKKECLQNHIENPLSYLFPWENIAEEWETVQGRQFRYGDLKTLENGIIRAVLRKD